MNAAQLTRLERLEDTAKRWKADNAIREVYRMDNKNVRADTWTQKTGIQRGKPIEFETVRAALKWTQAQMNESAQAQIYVDDVRDIMSETERAAFDALFPSAPDYKVMFDIRGGTDATAEALRLWRHFTSGIKNIEWWNDTNARIDAMLETA
jgi:hypothetical protein